MPIPFTCPHCGRQTTVADQYAGQTGPCAGCGKPITVPSAAPPPSFAPPPKQAAGAVVVVVTVVGIFMGLLTCGGILIALLLPAVQAAREAARRAQCCNNLKQIGLAMHNYHDTYGSFPPAYIADADGKPMHSWRVLILPFIEQSPLYDQYDFNEPWDGPNNILLADLIPSVYACSSHPLAGSDTCYAMIVGPGTISDGPSATRLQDMIDGTSNTLMIVEAAGSGINWMEPRDLDAGTISFQVNDPAETAGIKSDHPGGANVAICDGSVRFVSEQTPVEMIESMSTIGGQEPAAELPNF
jgi:prepilin-type processing-associated H-X9-DG protein